MSGDDISETMSQTVCVDNRYSDTDWTIFK